MTIKNYVLVHGAYHGGWCWKFVAELLRAQGHRVFTPTLTGLGERLHLLPSKPDLDTHIEDVVRVIANEELRDVILVGHSYGGAVVTGAADRARDAIAHLVYLDALVLQPGKAVLDGASNETLAFYESLRAGNDGPGAIPIPPIEFFAVYEQEQVEWLQRRLNPHPVETFFTKLRLQHPLGAGRPVTYITCTDPYFPQTEVFRNFAKTVPGWNQLDIATGHDAMVTAPEELAELLNNID